MALHKIKDFYPDYREQFGDHDILSYSLYAGNNQDKIGSIDDLLVDDEGRFRYLVINTGAWIFGKKVLLPIGQTRIDYGQKRVYADGLTQSQVENLPEYDANAVLDHDYEERVRGVYRSDSGMGASTMGASTLGTAAGTGMAGSAAMGDTSLDATPGLYDNAAASSATYSTSQPGSYSRDYDRDSYRYDNDPSLYNMTEQNHQTLRLYEENLIAGKSRQKTGDVVVGKRVETETQHVSIPIEKERVVIERVSPTDTTVTAGADAFQDGEVVRVEVYEETPEIRKETVLREEVRVRKEIDRETVEADETVRRERLDVDQHGNPIVRE